MFKVNNRNKKSCEICSKLTIKSSERRRWCRYGVFIVNFEHISHLFLVFLLLTYTSKCFLGWPGIWVHLLWRASLLKSNVLVVFRRIKCFNLHHLGSCWHDIIFYRLTHKCQCCPHTETSQLICRANQLTRFSMRATPALNGLKQLKLFRKFIIRQCIKSKWRSVRTFWCLLFDQIK